MVLIFVVFELGNKLQILSIQLLKAKYDGIIFKLLRKKDSGNSGFREANGI